VRYILCYILCYLYSHRYTEWVAYDFQKFKANFSNVIAIELYNRTGGAQLLFSAATSCPLTHSLTHSLPPLLTPSLPHSATQAWCGPT
jgi:hypothetical protein